MKLNAFETRIGTDKVLVYHPDKNRDADLFFVRRLQDAAGSHPKTFRIS